MDESRFSRRAFVTTVGAAAAGTALSGQAAAASGWTTAETPTEEALYDVEDTVGNEYAVGGAGIVLERTSEGWKKVLDGGPTGNANTLRGSDVTDDGERLWFVGNSGAIGEYDVTTGSLTDHSAPNDVTNNFNDVAVTGPAGDANVYVAGDSGKIYYSFENGESGTWNSVTPGSGSEINAIDFYDDRSGHAVDGNQTVFETDDGTTWDKIGIENANFNFYGVDSDGPGDVTVSGGGGSVYHYNGSEWRRADTGDADLRAIEREDATGLTVGGGGKAYRYDGSEWVQESTPTGANLKGVLLGSPDVAVGAGGIVIEHE
ncbi:hypothetical protein BRC94_10675 [Halobacteriales archaeon QS_5_70_17]|nr:MAG: hypothetical protein BRC94_10675 [Halobacteriales archaeon QS_5_70_17]